MTVSAVMIAAANQSCQVLWNLEEKKLYLSMWILIKVLSELFFVASGQMVKYIVQYHNFLCMRASQWNL